MGKTRFVLILMAFLLGACSSSFRADVTRFHEMSQPTGETFIVIAKDEGKKGSLELQNYARLVSDRLRAEGFSPAGEGNPDIIVKIDYSLSPPINKTQQTGYSSFYGGYGGFRSYGYGGYYFPWAGYAHPGYYHYPYGFGRGYGSSFNYHYRDYTYTVYDRVFEMVIEENAGGTLFEGVANSIGRDDDLVTVMPNLIDAMFTEFPGQSGSTQHYRIKPAKGDGY